MKWIYIPIVFILAFAYTKYSMSIPSKITENENFFRQKNRTPASTDSDLIYNELTSIEGYIVGDVTPENFVMIKDDNGDVFYSIEYFRNSKIGSLYLEKEDHFKNSKKVNNYVDFKTHNLAYIAGLLNLEYEFSKELVEKLRSFKKSNKINLELILMSNKSAEIKGGLKAFGNFSGKTIKEEIYSLNTNADILDIKFFPYKSQHEGVKILILFREDFASELSLIELEEFPLESYIQEQVVEQAQENFFNNRLSHALELKSFAGKYFILRRKNNFQKTVFENSKGEKSNSVESLYDQAYVLGKIHSKGLIDKKNEYIQLLEKFNQFNY